MIQKNRWFFLCIVFIMSFYLDTTNAAMAASPDIRSFYKMDYAGDTLSKGLDPNILFLLDTSTAMTFAPWGFMPHEHDNRSISERAQLLADSTFGHGMRPPLFNGWETPRINSGVHSIYFDGINDTSYSRYGRDMDINNNEIGNPNHYYTSDPDKFFLLTFRNRHLAHYDNWIDNGGNLTPPHFSSMGLPNGTVVGGPPTTEEINAARVSYETLRDYIPRRYVRNNSGVWVPASGDKRPPVPVAIANEHLVPNDSRLYKMKLVLWRLTEEPNGGMLSRMNVAFATNYQDYVSGATSAATKNEIPGFGPGYMHYYGASQTFRYGNAARYITGGPSVTVDMDNQAVYYNTMSQWSRRGVLTSLYVYESTDTTKIDFQILSRAVLFAPFNKLYEVLGANAVKTDKLDDFRSWISGYESYTPTNYFLDGHPSSVELRAVKDELWASGQTLLATAIYGGRNSSEGNHFPFHKGRSGPKGNLLQFAVVPDKDVGSSAGFLYIDPSMNTEGLRTGQAVGSVFDFFSPPDTNNDQGRDGVRFTQSTAGFFPVTGSCQQNWLVIFCAGNDAVPSFELTDAVERLFNATEKSMRGRKYNKSTRQWEPAEYKMDSGVRTLVVGFISKDHKEPEMIRVQAELEEIAKIGDPIYSGDSYVPNPYAKPEFANDAPGLLKALNSVLRRIHAERMGSGNPVSQPAIDDFTEKDARIIFGAAYRMNHLDQWDAWLSKYIQVSGDIPREQWEVNKGTNGNNGMIAAGTNRDLFTYTTSVERVSEVNLRNGAKVPMARANDFWNWLLRYNNYDQPNSDSDGILGDMLNSGITVVGGPKHKALKDNILVKSRDAVVYVQTNRGVLHAFNYLSGREIWGFIPPNIFEFKLRNLKFDENNEWIEGNGFTRVRSNPMVLLDGLLIARDVVQDNSVSTLLTGYLGRGGNGFYTMDISRMDGQSKEPRFEWAIENPRYQDTTGNVTVRRWGKAASGAGNAYSNYSDLGLTIVPGVYFTPAGGNGNTLGVLPGGLGHNLGRQNDSQGKAFFIFNPTDGSILRTIRNNDLIAPGGVKLGMGVSPIIYRENIIKETIEFYTADSEGNIIMCDTTMGSFSNWDFMSMFQFRSLGRRYYSYETSSSANEPVVIPRKMVLGRSRNAYVWLFGGTSDLYGPGSFASDSRKIINEEQFLFGLNTTNIPIPRSPGGPGLDPNNSAVRKLPYYIDTDLPAEYGRYGMPYPGKDTDTGINFGMDDYGWVMRLRPKLTQYETEAEYLSADPFLFNNILYLATFIPRSSTQSEEVCANVGVGKLYVLDPSTGYSMLDKPAIVLENIKIAGLSGNPKEHRLTLSLKELKVGALRAIFTNFSSIADLGNGLIDIRAPAGQYGSLNNETDHDFEEMVPHIQYWREGLK